MTVPHGSHQSGACTSTAPLLLEPCSDAEPLMAARVRCSMCNRALAGCWCRCVRAVDNTLPVLIVQHPDEAQQVKNTAGLLHRCLQQSQLVMTETMPEPGDTTGMVLLYPDTAAEGPWPTPAPWPTGGVQTLVVLDATWRKSRRMLHLNPWLAALPRLSLSATPPSRYAIRRAHDDDQRSTLEACALALAQLDQDPDRYQPLWAAMEDFIALQQQLMREGRARRSAGASSTG